MLAEILIYVVAGIGALVITGYTVHMFVGGIVSPEAEYQYIAMACVVVAAVIGFMAWDVIQQRNRKS